MTVAVEAAKVTHRIAFELIPVAASIALITVGIVRDELAMISVGAGIMGLPGIIGAAKVIKSAGRTSDA